MAEGPTRVSWTEEPPAEVRRIVEPLVERHLYLAPTWCHDLFLKWRPDLEDCACSSSDPEYRRSRIHFGPHFVDADPAYRESTVVHELLHLVLHPMTRWLQWTIGQLSEEDDRVADQMAEEWRERYEGAVCDLERSILGLHRTDA